MEVVETGSLTPGSQTPSANHQTYCALDSCLAVEVLEEIHRTFNQPPEIYAFTRQLQAPYLEMMTRGFLVDQQSRRQASEGLRLRLGMLRSRLNRLAAAVWDKPLNPRSPSQLMDFFYRRMKLPEVYTYVKGVRRLSTNREALEKLEFHLYARPFVALILTIRDLSKQLEVLETSIDQDGRFRTSYNITGTETGRPSSSENAFGTGGNAQNISPGLRYPFVADLGWKLCVIDLEQVEARDVGFFCGCLFDDWAYLDACEGGDLHTAVARLVWPREVAWTGDALRDKALAEETIFYRDYSVRYMSKRGSHMTNYMGTAWTGSRVLKIPLEKMAEFQARYVRGRGEDPKRGLEAIQPAFPSIARFWSWIASEIQTRGWLETPFGRKRHFFGRPGDDATVREGIAYMPQGTTADRTNLGLWRIWRRMPEVQVLANGYDSVTFQYRDEGPTREAETIGRALELMRVELRSPSGRLYVVPGEAKIGWNWGNQTTMADIERARRVGQTLPRLNLDGLVKFKPGSDTRRRLTGLDRIAM